MLNFGPTFRALTSGSPITTALNEARQMARRHLDAGGVVTPVDGRKGSPSFLVPTDVDPVALAAAIKAKLRAGGNAGSGRSGGLLNLLERRPDDRIVVPCGVLERLGGGNADRGERFLERLVSEMRRRRAGGRTAGSSETQKIVAARAIEQMPPAAAGFSATAS